MIALTMQPSHIIVAAFWVMIAAPLLAAFVAFSAAPSLRHLARVVLFLAWLSCGATTAACLWLAFGRPQTGGIGNQVFVLVAIPVAIAGFVWVAVWRAARRYAWEQSLPPDLRRIEELEDIERAIEMATKQLAKAERRVDGWFIDAPERQRLREEISMLQVFLARLEQARAERQPRPTSAAAEVARRPGA